MSEQLIAQVDMLCDDCGGEIPKGSAFWHEDGQDVCLDCHDSSGEEDEEDDKDDFIPSDSGDFDW